MESFEPVFSPPKTPGDLLKIKLASVVQAGHLKQPSEAESKAALLKGTRGDRRDPKLKLPPLSKDA